MISVTSSSGWPAPDWLLLTWKVGLSDSERGLGNYGLIASCTSGNTASICSIHMM